MLVSRLLSEVTTLHQVVVSLRWASKVAVLKRSAVHKTLFCCAWHKIYWQIRLQGACVNCLNLVLVRVMTEPRVLNLSTASRIAIKNDWLRKIFGLNWAAQTPALFTAGSVFNEFIDTLLELMLHLLRIHWSELGCPIASSAIRAWQWAWCRTLSESSLTL